jgi:hypothetical protein
MEGVNAFSLQHHPNEGFPLPLVIAGREPMRKWFWIARFVEGPLGNSNTQKVIRLPTLLLLECGTFGILWIYYRILLYLHRGLTWFSWAVFVYQCYETPRLGIGGGSSFSWREPKRHVLFVTLHWQMVMIKHVQGNLDIFGLTSLRFSRF